MEFMLAKEFTPNMKLPKKIKDTPPPIGWYMSEKLDGYRARYEHNTMSFVSRQNKPFHSPIWFTEFIGEYDLDGELFCSRDDFQYMGVVRKKVPIDEEWKKIKYCIYDAPEIQSNFSKRYEYLQSIISTISDNWNTYKTTLDSKFHDLESPILHSMCHIENTDIQRIEHFQTQLESYNTKKSAAKKQQSNHNYDLPKSLNIEADNLNNMYNGNLVEWIKSRTDGGSSERKMRVRSEMIKEHCLKLTTVVGSELGTDTTVDNSDRINDFVNNTSVSSLMESVLHPVEVVDSIH